MHANISDALPAWIPRRLLTVEEVAHLLHLSTRQVRRMIAKHQLQAVRLGRAVRIRPETLTALLSIVTAYDRKNDGLLLSLRRYSFVNTL